MTSGEILDSHSYPVGVSEEADEPPVFMYGEAPTYPPSKSAERVKGSATVSFVVGVDGHTSEIHIVSSTDPYFAGHTAYAIKDWVFKPATRDGKPVPFHIVQTMDFNAQ